MSAITLVMQGFTDSMRCKLCIMEVGDFIINLH